ncbi:MAG TPA: 2-C-methyl-D-erythritol 2,4-cyclodiphosphate synthase [Candidatus Berkiella sp.]|nr:2-C-methyl-D-erythritol 2,4-cyclodiphosphate synthase [Candidatus Berkiella sp.]
MMRIGHGYDIHRFAEEKTEATLVLGGVSIPYEKRLLAHSDGDLVIHALCDALLGALALGDIGQHFPDTDVQYKNTNSRLFLRNIMQLVKENGYQVGNVDISIIAQAPKLAHYKSKMCENLAEDLEVSIRQVNVKATTHENLDAIGQKLGIAAHAVALLMVKNENIVK